MSFTSMYDFLSELQENNNKEWMDLNRNQYHKVRNWFINWLDQMDARLGKMDEGYTPTPGKKGINRINNNLLYHPHRPVYKDHFGAGLDQASKQGDFYIQIGLTNSLIAGGYYRPQSKMLQSIRDAIDYNGHELKNILNKKSFKAMFGGLVEDEPLSNAPKGYSKDHPHLELLRNKTFAVSHELSIDEVCGNTFEEKVVQIYQEMLPFRRYLNQAVTV